MRFKIYKIIEPADGNNIISVVYDIILMIAILFSLIPLAFKNTNTFFIAVDKITVSIFIFDYLLKLFTADLKYNKKSIISFFKYPFSFLAIIDLLSILPSLTVLSNSFKLLKLFRLLRTLKVLKAFKIIRYSKSFSIISNVLKKQKSILLAVATLAVGYILISALLIFNIEPDSFNSFFDAVYWATVSLTTVGYGDIYPITTIGRTVAMVSSIFGIAVIALPAGVITAGYIDELSQDEK